MKGEHDRVVAALKKIADINNKSLPDLSSNIKIDVIC